MQKLPSKVKNIAGQRFGRLSAVEFVGLRPTGEFKQAFWRCDCDCGEGTVVSGRDLRAGNTTSCGCRQKEINADIGHTNLRHGQARDTGHSGAYRSYRSMIQRCRDPNCNNWERYGGRGIKVCERWASSFEAFYEDMGARPAGYSIERLDANGAYEPGNCVWLPRFEQSRNTRATRWVILDGERMIQADAARKLGITPNVIDGWRRKPHTRPSHLDLRDST